MQALKSSFFFAEVARAAGGERAAGDEGRAAPRRGPDAGPRGGVGPGRVEFFSSFLTVLKLVGFVGFNRLA